jgi:hypothetical protein
MHPQTIKARGETDRKGGEKQGEGEWNRGRRGEYQREKKERTWVEHRGVQRRKEERTVEEQRRGAGKKTRRETGKRRYRERERQTQRQGVKDGH